MPAEETGQRRLSAIMFTDMVGFTALAQRDERLALELLEVHRGLLRPVFARHGGREIKTIGDGFLVEFASALEGARCAIEIQRMLFEHNASAAAERRIQVRVGVHVGDVVPRDGDIVGDGVNIASRIETLADPGGICLSRPVFDQVRNKLDVPLVPLGERALKHVDAGMEVYRVVLPWGRTDSSPRTAPRRARAWAGGAALAVLVAAAAWWLWPGADLRRSPEAPEAERSIAVLPFVNMSAEAENEYLSDGMTEEIIGTLSKIEGLRVAARTSSFAFKGRNEEIQKVGRQLHVRSVLEGSVRRAGNRVRITAQLIDATNGYHLWSDTYEKDIADVFAIQTDVAERVADALKIELGVGVRERIRKPPTENVEAHQLYLKGRYYTSRFTREGFEKGMEYFRQAIALDPSYAPPYVGMAYYYISGSDAPFPPREAMPKAREAAEQALARDDSLTEARSCLADVLLLYDWDAKAAAREVQRAMASNQSSAIAHAHYAWLLGSGGRVEESIAESRRAVEIDPLSPEMNTFLGTTLYFARRYDQAIAQLRQTVDMDPNYWWGRVNLGSAYLMHGQPDDAIRELEAAQQGADLVAAQAAWTLGWAYAVAGRRDDARRVLDSLERQRAAGFVSAYGIATIHAGLGDRDRAFEWLDKAYEDRSLFLTVLSVDPALDGLRADPRFAALVDRVGLWK